MALYIGGNKCSGNTIKVDNTFECEDGNCAGSAQRIKDLHDNKEDNCNKTTILSSESTDIQYPSAKVVYDAINDIIPPLGTNTKGVLYLSPSSVIDNELPETQGYETLSVKKNEPGIKTYTYTLDEDYCISPFSLYNLVLYIDNMQTVQKYSIKAEWYYGDTLISEGTIDELKPTTSFELIDVPMNVNYLNNVIHATSGSTMSLKLTIENNILVTNDIDIYYGSDTVSCLIRNGGFVAAQEIYDMFEGITQTQSQINSTLKTRIAQLEEIIESMGT